MNLTTYIKVTGHRGLRLRILVRDPAWVAKGIKCAKGFKAKAWFQASKQPTLLGTIALSAVDLEYVTHECCHAAWELAGPEHDEETIATLTGELTLKVWLKLMELCREPV